MKTEYRSFWTWWNLTTKLLFKLGRSALSLQFMMGTGVQSVLTFWGTTFISLSFEMKHSQTSRKKQSSRDLLRPKSTFWTLLSKKWSERRTSPNLTNQEVVWLQLWSLRTCATWPMLEIHEQSWVRREETRFTLFQRTTARMTIMRREGYRKQEGRFIRQRHWQRFRRLEASGFRANTS